MMKCKYCGGNLTLEQAYCPHCGRPNEEAQQHVKDMEHYKSNFEDTRSNVYEVAQKNTEIMSHTVIITVLVILCVLVFLVSAFSWEIHRNLVRMDTLLQQTKYEKQLEQYLEEEDYQGFESFCERHYIRPYDDHFTSYQLFIQATQCYSYIYQGVMNVVITKNPDIFSNYFEQIADYYERLWKMLHPEEKYDISQYEELSEENKEKLQRIGEKVDVLMQSYFGMTEEELQSFREMSKAQKVVFLEERSEVMGYGKSVE